jgi:hypothetical protein
MRFTSKTGKGSGWPKMIFVLIGLLVVVVKAWAWSGAGHMVIAAQAWHELSPSLKSKVTELLKSHPEYGKWERPFQGNTSLDLATYAFMRASTWPDEIRRHHSKFDHPHWHYINYPLRPPLFQNQFGPTPRDDILYGIEQCEKILSDTKAPAEERAVYLSWLIHLIGDLHQPLHCSSFINETYPVGDKGGNDFYVKPGSRGIKLHSFWDGLLGTSTKPQSRLNYALEIQSEHPRKSLRELTGSKTVREWSLESRGLAIENGYLRGALKGSTSVEDAPSLPESYTGTAKNIAEKQAALAGYRLADEIRKCAK